MNIESGGLRIEREKNISRPGDFTESTVPPSEVLHQPLSEADVQKIAEKIQSLEALAATTTNPEQISAINNAVTTLIGEEGGAEAVVMLNRDARNAGEQVVRAMAERSPTSVPKSSTTIETGDRTARMERLDALAFHDPDLRKALAGWKNITSQAPEDRVAADRDALRRFHVAINTGLRRLGEPEVAFDDLLQ